MHLDKRHPVPIYLQLKELLQNQIEQGVYFSHQKLPSERDLCQHHNLSRMTARRALQELIDEGFAYTRVGKGTFVSESNPAVVLKATNGSEQLSQWGEMIDDERCRRTLLKQLLTYNSTGIEQLINEKLANYSLETVALTLFPQLIQQLEQLWRRDEIDLPTQNYAITTLRNQLIAMFMATGTPQTGPTALLGCAPGDEHELGLLLLGLSLRRQGFSVIYLGTNVFLPEFHQLLDRVQPQLICFSAATEQSAGELASFSQALYSQAPRNFVEETGVAQTSIFTFGGVAFTQNPALISNVSGLYLGQTLDGAITKVRQLFIDNV